MRSYFSRFFQLWPAIIFACLMLLAVPNALLAANLEQTMEYHLVSPNKALISPNGARLNVVETAAIKDDQVSRYLEFVLPRDAHNLHMDIPGQTIARWTSSPVILAKTGAMSLQREQLKNERDQLAARLETVKAQLSVWQSQTGPANPQDLAKRQEMMQQQLPILNLQQKQLQAKISLLDQEINAIPEDSFIGQKIKVFLTDSGSASTHAQIAYTYNINRCGWEAVYDFNVNSGKDKTNLINVRLLAKIWQYTGMDWKGTEITLATRGIGELEPAPLPQWIVGGEPTPKPQPRMLSMAKRSAGAPENMIALTADAATAEVAPVQGDTQGVNATWTLSAKGLPDGKSQAVILTDVWKTPLQWLARPAINNNSVFLLAKYNLPANQAWPAGSAQFAIDGQNVGAGYFMPKEAEVTLYFGPDPRVHVKTTVDTNRLGKTGFINTNTTWTGAWTYVISNEHDRAIKVKLERPAPMIGNEKITVTYKDQPPSTLDEKRHMVYWDVEVPAHGKSEIQHGIVISSPEKLPLFPPVQ